MKRSSPQRKGTQSPRRRRAIETKMVVYFLILLTIVAAGGTSVSRTDHVHVMMFCFMVKRIVGEGFEVISFRLFHSTLSLPLATTASSVCCHCGFGRTAGNSAFCSNFATRSHSDDSIIWVDRQQTAAVAEDSPCCMNHCYESNQASLTSYFVHTFFSSFDTHR